MSIKNLIFLKKYPIEEWIYDLSAIPELIASLTLKRLLSNKSLSTYHDHLRHAIASQAIIMRDAKYKQPSWSETIETLQGEKPRKTIEYC